MGKPVVEITEAAAERIKTLLAKGGGKVLRLSVGSSGCAGMRYDFAYAPVPSPGDEKVEAHGATIHVDQASILYLLGTTVDWQVDKMETKFAFINPLETSRCGCGESFHI
jgi:iron-sulfur cluster assembly protein